MAMRSYRLLALAVGVVSLGATMALSVAQGTPASKPADTNKKPIFGGLTFKTNVGSFKLLGAGEVPASGKLTIKFKGTVLVSGAGNDTKVTTSGKVLREINDTKTMKSVYHGEGTLVVDGKVRAVQFFGRDLDGRFYGMGIFRLYGEFDKDLNTGTYKFDGDETKIWGTGGVTCAVPSLEQATPKPIIKIVPKGG